MLKMPNRENNSDRKFSGEDVQDCLDIFFVFKGLSGCGPGAGIRMSSSRKDRPSCLFYLFYKLSVLFIQDFSESCLVFGFIVLSLWRYLWKDLADCNHGKKLLKRMYCVFNHPIAFPVLLIYDFRLTVCEGESRKEAGKSMIKIKN